MTLFIVIIAVLAIGSVVASYIPEDEDIVVIESVDGSDGNWKEE